MCSTGGSPAADADAAAVSGGAMALGALCAIVSSCCCVSRS